MLPIALDRLFKIGVRRESRNGPVLQLRGPTLLCYERPLERVVFWPERNANPFFHVMESVWMLAGRNDVELPAKYAASIARYSDDGRTFNGAYGYRWREAFGKGRKFDQLTLIARRLKNNPDCRRQVLSMWDPETDLNKASHSKDVPCNTHAYFSRDERGRLDMTVCNRSNDLVWGCLGANVVHFSYLLEYMAGLIGCEVGSYCQFTNNLHGYLDTVEPLREIAGRQGEASPYEAAVQPFPMKVAGEVELLDADFHDLGKGCGYRSSFFTGVVAPMELVWDVYKNLGPSAAVGACDTIVALDWRRAAAEWMRRCAGKRLRKAQDDGVSYE